METRYLDNFLTVLNEKVNGNSKYDSFLKEVFFHINNYKEFLNKTTNKITNFTKNNVEKLVIENKEFHAFNEKSTRALNTLIAKNNEEVKKIKEQNHEKHTAEKKLFQLHLENIKAIDTKNLEQAIQKILVEQNRNIHKLEEEKALLKTKYQDDVRKNEEEFKNLKTQAIIEYNANINMFSSSYNQAIKKNLAIKTNNKTQLEQKQKQNDEIYLNIKTEYNEQAKALNLKINEIKKNYSNLNPKLEKLNDKKLQPLLEKITNLKLEQSEKLRLETEAYHNKLIDYQNEFQALNLKYEEDKQNIIKNYNEQMSLFNSKLSSYKEEITNKKLELEKDTRAHIKDINNVKEKDRLNRKLTKELNAFDNSTNKEILLTNNLLTKNHINYQKQMLLNDFNYTKAKNMLLAKHELLTKEYEINIKKINEFYNSEINLVDNSKKVIYINDNYYRSLNENNEKLELLPLEKQLTLSSYLHEREVNSLANDASEESLFMQKNITIADLEKAKEQNIFNLNKNLEKDILDINENKANANLQLNQEKIRRVNNYKLEEQNLKQNLIKLTKSNLKLEKENDIQKVNLKKSFDEKTLINDFNLFVLNITNENNTEAQKREYIIKDATLKSSLRNFLEKNALNLFAYEKDLNESQFSTEVLFSNFRNKILLHNTLEHEIVNLYNKPAHPEILKACLNVIKTFIIDDQNDLFNYFESSKEAAKEFYLKKMDETTGYKYMAKHQSLIDKYDNLITTQVNLKQEIEKLIISYENQRAVLVGNKDKIKLNKQAKETKDKIKEIEKNILTLEKNIFLKQRELLPINDKIALLNKEKAKHELLLTKEKQKENIIFDFYIAKNLKIYKKLKKLIEQYYTKLQSYYQILIKENYITLDLIEKEYKTLALNKAAIETNLLKIQNLFLDHYLAFYNEMKTALDLLNKNFTNTTNQLIKNLKTNYEQQANSLIKNYKQDLQNKKANQAKTLDEYEKNIKALDLELQKMISQNNEKIKATEFDLKNIEKLINADTLSLEDNALQVNNQYIKDLDDKKVVHLEEITKVEKDYLIKQETAEKNYLSQVEALKNKTQSILIKYENQKQKLFELSEQKITNIEKDITNEQIKFDNKLKQNEHHSKEILFEKDKNLKLLDEDYQFFVNVKLRVAEKKSKKDYCYLKKSYRFKKKLLL